MAQFDVYSTSGLYLVDCQSGLLSGMATRFVVPLIPVRDLPLTPSRLNPVFDFPFGRLALAPQGARTVLKRDLRDPVASLRDHDTTIIDAIDMLLSGI
jgi:toxin CcdB